jgi:RHS repeat-associated protein
MGYLSNESEELVDVFFDDLKVEHVKSPIVEAQDFMPFGLTFNQYTRENATPNRWKFQGQEHIDDLGLNWDSFKWRNHQPDIGRFFNVDPLAEDYFHNSPYAFSENHVTAHVELEGLEKINFMAVLFEPHKSGDLKVIENRIIDRRSEIRNKTIHSITTHTDPSKALKANVDLGSGKHSGLGNIQTGESMGEEVFDMVTTWGDTDNFSYDFETQKTEEGSQIQGQIDGTSFSIDVEVTDETLVFDVNIAGGDTDQGLVIRVGNNLTIGYAQGGRDSNSDVRSRIIVPYSMDKNGNVVISDSYWRKQYESDAETSTKDEENRNNR